MKDTTKEIEKIYFEMIMKKTPEERFYMGSRMFDAARDIVLASFPENLTLEEKRERLFLRFYENDFDEKELNRIIEWIKTTPLKMVYYENTDESRH